MKRFIYKLTYPLAQMYWRIFKPKTYGVKIIIEHEGKLLMIKNSYGGDAWTFPGGGIERHEEAVQAAIREAREEVGIPLVLEEIREVGNYVTDHEGKIDTVHVFMAKGFGAVEIDGEEVIQADWFPKEQLPDNLGIQARKSLETWQTKTPR